MYYHIDESGNWQDPCSNHKLVIANVMVRSKRALYDVYQNIKSYKNKYDFKGGLHAADMSQEQLEILYDKVASFIKSEKIFAQARILARQEILEKYSANQELYAAYLNETSNFLAKLACLDENFKIYSDEMLYSSYPAKIIELISKNNSQHHKIKNIFKYYELKPEVVKKKNNKLMARIGLTNTKTKFMKIFLQHLEEGEKVEELIKLFDMQELDTIMSLNIRNRERLNTKIEENINVFRKNLALPFIEKVHVNFIRKYEQKNYHIAPIEIADIIANLIYRGKKGSKIQTFILNSVDEVKE